MRLLVILIFVLGNTAHARFFVEPGVFMNMYDGSSVTFENDSEDYQGQIRNAGLSYAIKIGMHYGHWEYGLETEVYQYEAHLERPSGNSVEEMSITYNGVFVGYEFVKHNFFYLQVSFEPYLSSGGRSYHEKHPVLSMEYSRHIKDWVSLNVKFEKESEFSVENSSSNERVAVGNMLLVGFSFPLIENDF